MIGRADGLVQHWDWLGIIGLRWDLDLRLLLLGWAGLQVYICWLEESLICDKSLVYQFLEDLIKCCGWF